MRLRSKRILAKQKTTRYAGVSKKLYIKITFPYNRGAQATIEERKGDFMPKANSAAHTKCANTILSSRQSIGER